MHFEEKVFKNRQVIYSENDPADELYFILEGSVEVIFINFKN